MLEDLVRRSRSYRRFDQAATIARSTLEQLVDVARLCPSGMNRQSLKYLLSCAEPTNALIFPRLAWAGFLKDWPGPAEGERPTGYIVVLNDKRVAENPGCDHGIAAQTILLAAVERGLGGCMIGSIQRNELARELSLADHLEVLLVIALGRPAEAVVVESVAEGGDTRYWRDEQQVHHVPKRALDELIVG